MQTPWLRSFALVATTLALALTPACSCDDTTSSDPDDRDEACGDGTVDAGEACDDGNIASGDGCSASCQTEGQAVCGDGTVDATEECDDGNTDDGDGCAADCTNEVLPVCGNGTLETDEDCDDGNDVDFDGCQIDCTLSPEEVFCEDLPPLSAGTCEVTTGGAQQLIYGDVLAPFTVFRGGQVLVEATGLISCLGCECAAMASSPTVIRCPNGVVSAGLINAHEHITYIQNNPYVDTGERYEHRNDWGNGDNGHTEITGYSGGASDDEKLWGELRHMMGGATSIIGSGEVEGLMRNLDTTSNEGLGQPSVEYETFPISGDQTESGCGYSSITSNSEISGYEAYFPHISEGISLSARNEFVCTEGTPTGSEDLLEPQSAYIHAEGLNPVDYARMADQDTAMIWSPRSNITLYGDTAAISAAASVGTLIALGTDWMPTGSMNMQRELECADSFNQTYLDGYFSDRQLWQMVTINAARAAQVEDAIGQLVPDRVADIAIYDGSVNVDHRAVIDAQPEDTVLVMRGGDALYGDDAVIQALRPSDACDTFAVCGADKGFCASADFGKTYATLVTDVGAIYPLFYCNGDTPLNEPTCQPTRPASVNGSSIYDGVPTGTDADGDSIEDSSDNCPTMFNPVRPMDSSVQGDFDLDGQGDVCDPCPLDPESNGPCAAFNTDDIDNDGIANTVDNCFDAFNDDQADGDNDERGDMCDRCPAVPNMAPQACPVSIYSIKGGTAHGTVGINGALVTGCRNGSGFFVQVKETDPGYVGPEDSGIFVYHPSIQCGTTLTVGNRVNINPATVDVFAGQTQLGFATLDVMSGTESAPVPVDKLPSEIAGTSANEYDGVLVRVVNVLVTDDAPTPGTGDSLPTNEFVVGTPGVRVNDFLYLVSTPPPPENTNYDFVAGIAQFNRGNMKIEPRGALDIDVGPPVLVGFGPSPTFIREDVAADFEQTIPQPLMVRLSSAALTDTFVDITSNDAAVTVENDGVMIPMGATEAPVTLDGTAQHAGVILTATLTPSVLQATVRVVGDAELPRVASIDPDSVVVAPGGMTTFTAFLDIPAGVGGEDLIFSALTLGTIVEATVTVPEDEISAVFTFSAGTMEGVETLDVSSTSDPATLVSVDIEIREGSGLVINELDYDQPGTDMTEFVEIYNNTGSPIALADLIVVFISGSTNTEYRRVVLTGSLGGGQYLVIGPQDVLDLVPGTEQTILLAGSNLFQNEVEGVAIFNLTTDTMIDALSYEGSVTAGVINMEGPQNFVEGTETDAIDNTVGSLIRSPNGEDTDNAADDWAFNATMTPGSDNP